MKKLGKKIIYSNYFLYWLILSIYNYFFWYGNLLTNYYFEKRKFKKKLGYKLNLKNPRSFNEKVVYKKIYDRNPLLTKTSDKVAVRDYIREVLGKKEGEKHLIPLLYVTDNPETIPFEKFPKDFIIKANHGSGWNIIIRDGKYNKKEIIKKCKTWLNTPHGLDKMEWAYKNVKRKILIEELLLDEKGQVPKDYKFFVFDGKVKLVFIDFDRFENHTRSLFDENWNHLNATLKYPIGKKIRKPKKFEKMKKIAEKLGEPFDHIRVDLYLINDNIYFGELTSYQGSGVQMIKPRSYDFELGKYWKIK
ncbi:MAG: ATP-grasp fold amidoligase family protein [Nanoarchaeota archaeon]